MFTAHYETSLYIYEGGPELTEHEVEVEIEMTSQGAPSVGPSYSHGGLPAEPPEFEAQSVRITAAYRVKQPDGTYQMKVSPTILTTFQFEKLFPVQGLTILEQAIEWASDNEDQFYD